MKYAKRTWSLFILVLSFQIGISQTTSMTSFIFGHSLLDHRPPLIPTPSNETTVPHWMYLLAQEAGHDYSVSGQYGFLPQHANLPPFSQWGYDIVPPAWESDLEPFSDADFNNILITAANFAQWQGPNIPYPGQGTTSPISATEDIVDWLVDQEDGLKIYIYENWPDMAGYLSGGFPPSDTELTAYYAYTTGAFHDWWIEYQDSLLLSRPDANVRMIPVGPILADLLTNTVLNQIPVTELYEDDAPHGRASLYFLASLITYMATYEEMAPATYTVPTIVHSIIQDNYAMVVSHIWNELESFNDVNGTSRVFGLGVSLPVELIQFKARPGKDGIELLWTTQNEVNNAKFEIEHSINGINFSQIGEVQAKGNRASINEYTFVDTDHQFGRHYYRLKQIDRDGSFAFSPIVQVNGQAMTGLLNCYPNPSQTGEFYLELTTGDDTNVTIELWTSNGQLVQTVQHHLSKGMHQLSLDYSTSNNGLFFLKVQQGEQLNVRKIHILKE